MNEFALFLCVTSNFAINKSLKFEAVPVEFLEIIDSLWFLKILYYPSFQDNL